MFSIIDLFPVVATIVVSAIICFVIYKSITGNQTATIILTAVISFLILVGAAAAGTAETQQTYWLRHVSVEIQNDYVLFTRLADGEMFSIDYEPGWIPGESVVIIHDNGTPADPLDDVVVSWLEWAAMGCDAQLVFE